MRKNRVKRRKIKEELIKISGKFGTEKGIYEDQSIHYKEEKERVIGELMKIKLPEISRAGRGEFILSQFGLIRRTTWILHGVWLCVLLHFIQGEYYNKSVEALYSLLTIVVPVLVVLSVEEISCIYQKSMLEIEYATKYSLQKVVLLRLVFLGGMDAGLLMVVLLLGQHTELSMLRMMIYGYTAFFIMCAGCLELMKYYSGDRLKAYCLALAVLLAVLSQLGMLEPLNIYSYERILFWLLLFIATAAAVVIELRSLGKRLLCFEQSLLLTER